MKLWLIEQKVNGYGAYDAAVVRASTAEIARNIDPGSGIREENPFMDWAESQTYWCNNPEEVSVRYLGETLDEATGVVLASFNES